MNDNISKLAKEEITKTEHVSGCCNIAFLSALIHTAGSIIIRNKKISVMIVSENKDLKPGIDRALSKLYGFKSLKKNKEIYLYGEYMISLLIDCGIIRQADSLSIVPGIEPSLVREECCRSSYVAGAFLGAGSISVLKGGYHLEFSLSNKAIADDLVGILEGIGISAKTAQRKERFVVYIKDNEAISDCLAYAGAAKAVIKLNELYVDRQVRQQTNRRMNCDFANLDKTVTASMRQTGHIESIYDALPDGKLKETAKARLDNPEATYEQLAEILGLSKSGLKHRLKKLEQIGAAEEESL